MKISFTIGRKEWQYKPRDAEVALCQAVSHYRRIEASVEQIYGLITSGRCWRAGILKENARDLKKASFVGAQVLALDFDAFSQPPEETVEYCRRLDLEPNFWYYSFSQGDKPLYNYRVVWVLDRLLNENEYEDLYKRVLTDELFSKADKATKDINRLWFGTNKGGKFIKEDATPFEKFGIFQSVVEKPVKRGNSAETEYEQEETAQQFIMDNGFDWRGDLDGVCDLWDKWVRGIYLHYHQRLLLFSELKMLRYDSGIETKDKYKFLNEIMTYYREELYRDSKCNRQEISYFLSDKTKSGIKNKIVKYGNGEYTIAEYFLQGIYKKRRLQRRVKKIRIPREELQQRADTIIPRELASRGIKYIECQTESGKTERILNYLAEQDYSQVKIIYAMPTHILLKEVIKRAEDKGIKNILCPRKVDYTDEELLYLDAGFPEGVFVSQDMIARKKELEAVKDPQRKGLFFLTHSAIAHLSNITADLIIIDENIEDCLIDRNIIKLDALNALRAFIPTITNGKGERIDGRNELDKIIEAVENGAQGDIISGIDIDLIFKYLDYRRLVESQVYKDTPPHIGIRGIGKLRDADILKVGEDSKGNKYLYFEKPSKLLRNCLDKGIPVKLFTGTPKITQLKEGLSRDPELVKAIGEPIRIPRADPLGTIIEDYGKTGSKASLFETFRYAIEKLEEKGIDWQNIPLLTLKSGINRAKELGFKIAQTENGEELYIENSAGINALAGSDLIVIGKPDIPLNVYLDMVDDPEIPRTKGSITRQIEDTGKERILYGYLDPLLFRLQTEQIREGLEQAVARARTLWYDCNVYVFCDYPLRATKDDDTESGDEDNEVSI